MSTQPVQKDFWSLCAESSLNVLPDEFNPSGSIMVRAAVGVSSAHRVKYVEWEGKGEKGTLICVHGVFRNSRDFDVIAQHLADRGWRVVAGFTDQVQHLRFSRKASAGVLKPRHFLGVELMAQVSSSISRAL